jgi:DNA-binding NtrC family response regulator
LYRINTMEINLPPLRERKDDIVPMAHFLLKQLEKYNKAKSFWQKRGRIYGTLRKGNRELENKIERALIMSDDNTISVTI